MLTALSMFGTAVFNMIPIVISEMMGPENVPSCMGVLFVYQAVGIIASTFSIGKLASYICLVLTMLYCRHYAYHQ